MTDGEFLSSSIRPGHPDFLDLPWEFPLEFWQGRCNRLEDLPQGVARHPVVFLNYSGSIFAMKETTPQAVAREYDLLRRMEEMKLPSVIPAGHVRTRHDGEERGVLITRYLDHSVPYQSLFKQRSLARYREHLLDAMASLLVQLHLAGVYWGDCSLANTLFRRDAGALQAYLVDAETSEVYPKLSDGQRQQDLDVLAENLMGGLMDLAAIAVLPPHYSVPKMGAYVLQSYQRLWNEVTREEIISPGERYKIRERVRRLNEMGFSVDEVNLVPAGDADQGEQLRMRAFVTDRKFHRDLLNTLTGITAGGYQARQMINEIREVRATLSRQERKEVSLSSAAHHWLNEIYTPTLESLQAIMDKKTDLPQLYCQILEHKWFLSERARKDVGHRAAVEDYLQVYQEKKHLLLPESLPPSET